MQLNIYVPEDRVPVVQALDEASRATGRPKNEIVLEALEQYLATRQGGLGRYHLGAMRWHDRGELYEERLDRWS